jgi:threonyl-tRNA synthetase
MAAMSDATATGEEVVVTLPDGSTMAVERGTTVEEVAYGIGSGLGRDTVAGVLDGDLVDTATPIESDSQFDAVTDDTEEYLRVLRHSAAHVFAQALGRLYPEARLAIGPPTDEGFYYDIANVDLDSDDLAEIEAEAEEIIDDDLDIERYELSREEAISKYEAEDNPYKLDILETEAADDDPIWFYEQGEFEDLCRGPHVPSTGEIGGFGLLQTSAAYWRGEEENDSLTRVYGTAFESESELEEFLERRREAEERDHRKIGREMDLFSIPDHAPGNPHYHPDGMTVRRELEEYIREKNDELGYDEVWTPALNKAELWKPTGHYDTFTAEGEMFNWEQDGTEFGLKPMNCANHASIYADERHSYRELPIRFAEFGTVFRNEQSGELSGLLRVRAMTQDDGHAFIRPDQLQGEIVDALGVIDDIYGSMDLAVNYVLETKGDNAVGSDAIWERATESLREALGTGGFEYEIDEGEAAFYGPKIGINAVDALGREWTIGTVQVDFNIPERLDLTYVNQDNEEKRPVMIHRALLGSFERFMGVAIEHFKGNFPLWLAPEQVRILPVADDNTGYAEDVAARLNESDFRVGVERRSWTVGRKIRQGHDDRVPYMLLVGDDEESSGTVSVRDRAERDEGGKGIDLDEFRAHLEAERREKRTEPDFLA